MASVVGSGLFNTVAFAGTGILFFWSRSHRHNKTLEYSAKAKEKWYESEVAKKDRIRQLREQLSNANSDINQTNKALGRQSNRLQL